MKNDLPKTIKWGLPYIEEHILEEDADMWSFGIQLDESVPLNIDIAAANEKAAKEGAFETFIFPTKADVEKVIKQLNGIMRGKLFHFPMSKRYPKGTKWYVRKICKNDGEYIVDGPGYMYAKKETAIKDLNKNMLKAWVYDTSKIDWDSHDWSKPTYVELSLKDDYAS